MSLRLKRRPLRPVAAAFGLALVCLVLASLPTEVRAARPNIVVIQTDDQSRAMLRAVIRNPDGTLARAMPNTLREVVRRGVEFTDTYATSPVCAPSRASLLSGQHPHNSGLMMNLGATGGWSGWQALPIADQNLPVALRGSGYRTVHLGKFINGYNGLEAGDGGNGVPAGWDRWLAPFKSDGSDGTLYYGYELNDGGVLQGPIGPTGYVTGGKGTDSRQRCDVASLLRPIMSRTCRHLTDVTTRAAVQEIRAADSDSERPLYLQVDYPSPHMDPRPTNGPEPAARHAWSASRTALPRPPSFNEPDISDKPALLQGELPRMDSSQIQYVRAVWRRSLEALRTVDDGVGAIVRTLERVGRLRNTYIFFTADNGLHFGEHRVQYGKFLAYEPSATIPLAVRGPGIPAGEKSGEVVSNVDVSRTILGLSGARTTYETDGRSLQPFWQDPGRRSQRPVGFMVPPYRTSGSRSTSQVSRLDIAFDAFRVGPIKFIRWENGERELYDLDRDPGELQNRISDPAYAEAVDYMASHAAGVAACSGNGCRQTLPPLPPLPPLPGRDR